MIIKLLCLDDKLLLFKILNNVRNYYRDSVSSDVVDLPTRVMAIQNVTNLLTQTFSSQFVFPVLGHDDPGALKNKLIDYTSLGHYWRQWLPTDAIQTFNKGKFCACYYCYYFVILY